ncbi:hypothetical protein J7T55_013243 [Diaporthe amygdali]|uniref:uncharacterized protein n=1 Tax=Phomopsis amygdali TaxID=1214568 RepID=UPI0022FDFBE4|nr:uncharacterized protein J7T55_013243 [Diaporthe amygdali]KAJ0119008.1 hypothetical protein J7T55_013243 [Diaporthe amygdali]
MADPHSERLDLDTFAVAASQPDTLRCCCGNTDCVYLKHNCSVLDSVEKDVHTAAKLGQALLARHEAYMASAERDRYEMQSRIEQLETEKRTLEAENARTIQENRALLDQLESYNNSVIDSETQIRSLEATLQSSEQAIRKLQGAEARATEMEDQLANLEAEQAALRNTLVTTEGEARSAMQRWRRAEKGISDLQEKLEKIEREACEERQRHAEVLARMEKQRSMEKDLNTAAGRLKGAAAAKTMGEGNNGGTVVSHFVRDLLQDNANLQVGMAELRELLLNSNDEIQHLREQLIFHQPVEDRETSAANTLRAELDPDEMEPPSPTSPKSPQSEQKSRPTASVSQELHIHHHYHVAKAVEPKKPKKKRQNLTHNIFNPSRNFAPSSPPSPGLPHWRLPHTPSAPTLISHSVRDSISTAPSTRWSVFSEQPSDFAPSSVPSSPVSNRRGSVFDRTGHDTSYPTSPVTSIDPTSPVWTRHKKQPSDASRRKFSVPRPLFLDGLPEDDQSVARRHENGNASKLRDTVPTILTTSEDGPESTTTAVSPEELTAGSTDSGDAVTSMPLTPSYDDCYHTNTRPRLHRAASSESIMSLTGGLDIHTLKARPSQLSFRPLGAAMADIGLSAVTARPTIARGSTQERSGGMTLRDKLSHPNFRAGDRAASASAALSSLASTPEVPQRSASGAGFGKLVGWRPWASTNSRGGDSASNTPTSDRSRSMSPNPASGSSPATSVIDVPRASSSQTPKKPPPKELAFSPRTFGINQPGAIPGFQEYLAYHQRRGPQAKVVPDVVDTEALREILEEEGL